MFVPLKKKLFFRFYISCRGVPNTSVHQMVRGSPSKCLMNRLAVYSKDLILNAGMMGAIEQWSNDSYSYSIINHIHVFKDGTMNWKSNTNMICMILK